MDNKGLFIAGIVFGGAVGVLAGMLFAPASGKENRKQLRDSCSQLGTRAKEEVLKLTHSVVEKNPLKNFRLVKTN